MQRRRGNQEKLSYRLKQYWPAYLLLLPVVVGISYELIKLAGRSDGIFTRIISAPGMWLQHITTCEPDDGQIECAIAALTAVIPEDENADRW